MPTRPYKTKQCPNDGCARTCAERASQCLACSLSARREAAAVVANVPLPTPAERLVTDQQESRTARQLKDLQARYRESLQTIDRYEQELQTVTQMREGLETYNIEPSAGSGANEATVVVVASDWHIEERVGAEVGGLNVFNEGVANQRIARFFQKAHDLTELLAARIEIPTMVLALLGDFISNAELHGGDNAESMEEAPMHAIVRVQSHLISGIKYLLQQAPTRKLVIPCHSGNHARTTQKIRFSAENGHSLEYLMYQLLAAEFRNDPRVTFIIPEGPHSYLDIYGQTVRFHHGHMVKYGGGVGGIYIPVHKAIAQWNKARPASLDVFGHFHQSKDGGNFLCNGSLIGYNGYALSLKCDFEVPRQTLFLVDRKRGRTFTVPIYL